MTLDLPPPTDTLNIYIFSNFTQRTTESSLNSFCTTNKREDWLAVGRYITEGFALADSSALGHSDKQ